MSSLSNFQKLKELGKGSFSIVYKVNRKTDNKEYAMKVVKITQLSEKERQNALNEIRILASIVDPYIIAYKEAFFDENIRCLCIIMEYADGGDLMMKINAKKLQKTYFSESQIWRFLLQMTKGLRTLHTLKILHRDLKCANVFQTSDGVLKLGDLNVSKITQKGLAITQAGTPYYCAPEVWKGNVYDKKCDIWSLGCVLYELTALKPPFQGNGMKDLFNRISKGEFERIPKCYSNELYEIIKLCLKVNANERPNCDELLNHPLIKEKFPGENTKERVFSKAQLLNTIKMPRNLQGLKEKLPKPNYQLNNKSFEEEENERNLRKRCPSESGLKERGDVNVKEKVDLKVLKKNFKEENEKYLNLNERHLDERSNGNAGEIKYKANNNKYLEKPPLIKNNKVEQPSKNEQLNRNAIKIERTPLRPEIKKYEEPSRKNERPVKKQYEEPIQNIAYRERPASMKKHEEPIRNNGYIERSVSRHDIKKQIEEPMKNNGYFERPVERYEIKKQYEVERPVSKHEIKKQFEVERPVSKHEIKQYEEPIKNNGYIEIKKHLGLEEKKQSENKPMISKRVRILSEQDQRLKEKEKVGAIKNNCAMKKKEIIVVKQKTPVNKENISEKRYPGLEVKNKKKY